MHFREKNMISFITALLLVLNVHASPETDAIKAQSGCYKVDFNFEETEKTDPNYPISSKPYHEWGIEWVELDYSSENEVHLQHILVTPQGPLKHWRQEWQRNPTQIMSFVGNNTWTTGPISKPIENLWLQKVYQVDDSPRYECAAPWNISAENSSWYCKAWSPLPRREFSQRNDYNILDRGNFVVLNTKGWVHHQRNEKVLTTPEKTEIIAKEKGANKYEKIDDSECAAAKTYWKENKQIWHDIQATWKDIYAHHPDLKLKAQIDGKVLWMHLFELADAYAKKTEYVSKVLQKEAHDVIHNFMDGYKNRKK